MIKLTLEGLIETFIPIEEAAKVVKEGEDILKEKECIA